MGGNIPADYKVEEKLEVIQCKIYAAMAAILAEFPVVTKERRAPIGGTGGGYAYRGIDDVYVAVHGLLAKHGVVPVPTGLNVTFAEAPPTKSGTAQRYCTVCGTLRFYAIDGSYVDASLVGEGLDTGDKGLMKAISNGTKYTYWNTFAVPSAVMKDSEAFSEER